MKIISVGTLCLILKIVRTFVGHQSLWYGGSSKLKKRYDTDIAAYRYNTYWYHYMNT